MQRPHIALARQLRQGASDAEALLWKHLRGRRLAACKFRRQLPVGPFVVDFAAPGIELVVELDGGQHVERAEYDAWRTAFLEACGYQVLRYWNDQVLKQTADVLADLHRSVVELQHGIPLASQGDAHLAPPGRGRRNAAGEGPAPPLATLAAPSP